MTLRLCFMILFGLAAASCSGNKQQGVATPPPTAKTTEPSGTETDDQVVDDENPFAGINDEAEEDIEDPADVDVPVSSDISTTTNGGGGGLSSIMSMLPMITGLMSGQMPDIGSILGMMGGGGGGALGGLSGLLGGKP